MDTESHPDLTRIKILRELSSSEYRPDEVAVFLQDGWKIVAVRTVRHRITEDEFRDELIYTIGNEQEPLPDDDDLGIA